MLEDFSQYLLVSTANSYWDFVVCRSLGTALKDKCLRDGNQGSRCLMPSSQPDGRVMTSVTTEFFMQLFPPLLSSLSNSRTLGSSSIVPSRLSLQRQTASLVLATAQLSTVWVMSKAFQFLSSWSLNRFLLITQGDLKVLRESVDVTLLQTKSLMVTPDHDHQSSSHNHNQLLLRQQLGALDRAVSELQTFSSLVLKTFSSGCKRMSGEIFEQTMPSAVHWRLRTGFPSNPSEYASLAAQSVIGQVLEGVAPLSDDARIQALSVTVTAFMEAWMEHILKNRIKFSVQGALQLKQDFDSIRDLIKSDRSGLPDELHQRLLSLRVFQQVDSAVLCLLQQPQVKPYLQPRAWEPFTRCCPSKSSRNSFNAAVGSSITNLRSMEGDDMTQSNPSVTDISSFTPGEPYLAPSVALGASQQEWLDLRIHSSTRRWKLPGLQCLSKSEP
ncbi:coiled-coil domain-containing protein 142 [Aulostomus maculatus]